MMTKILYFIILILFIFSCNTPINEDSKDDKKENEETIDLSSGLIAHYLFNGNANDSSGKNNHGTFNGGLLANTQDRFLNGNNAISFDGNDDYFSTNITDLGNIYTLSLWFKDDSFADDDPVLSKQSSGSSSNAPMRLMVIVTNFNGIHNQLQFTANSPGGNSYGYTTDLSENIWYNIIMTCDGKNHSIFLNGVKTGGGGGDTLMITNLDPILLGKLLTDYFTGTLDDFRIYNRVLNNSEISALYNQEKP